MKADIILAGVGGQGILSIAAALGAATLNEGLYLKQAETHGMSQRGGAVVSHLRIADYPIASDLIPLGKADIIISVEPMESLRYLPYLSETGFLVTNEVIFENIPNYPLSEKIFGEIKKLTNFVALNAEQLARDVGNPKASNMVMLGASSPFIEISSEIIEKGIAKVFERKGNLVVNSNIEAFRSGKDYATKYLK